jgi:hypothetical protein
MVKACVIKARLALHAGAVEAVSFKDRTRVELTRVGWSLKDVEERVRGVTAKYLVVVAVCAEFLSGDQQLSERVGACSAWHRLCTIFSSFPRIFVQALRIIVQACQRMRRMWTLAPRSTALCVEPNLFFGQRTVSKPDPGCDGGASSCWPVTEESRKL